MIVLYSPYSFTPLALSAVPSATPLWDIGINGTGQFVQVTDTGFDDASCFLRGDAGYGSGRVSNRCSALLEQPVTDFSKRKVRCIESRSRL